MAMESGFGTAEGISGKTTDPFGFTSPESWRHLDATSSAPYRSKYLDKGQAEIASRLLGVDKRTAPTYGGTKIGDVADAGPDARLKATQLDAANDAEVRLAQKGLLSQLQGQAAGTAPSLAQQQMMQAQDRNLRTGAALAAGSSKGANAALGLRTALMANGEMGAQNAQQAGILRLQEQQGAMNQLAGLTGQMRQADLSLAGQNAQLEQQAAMGNQQAALALAMEKNKFTYGQAQLNQQTGLANQEAQLKAMGMNDAAIASLLGMRFGMEQNQNAAMQEWAKQYQQNEQFKAKMASDEEEAAAKRRGGFFSAIGSAFALSDEREKGDVVPGGKSVRKFLDGLDVHAYTYKDPEAPGAGHGTFVSPMAQEIESTSLGKGAVVEGPEGRKMVDYGKLSGAMLGGLVDMHDRLKRIEGVLGKKVA